MKYYLAYGYYLKYHLHRYSNKSNIVSYYNTGIDKWIRYPMKWDSIEQCLESFKSLRDEYDDIKSISKKEVTKYMVEKELEK